MKVIDQVVLQVLGELPPQKTSLPASKKLEMSLWEAQLLHKDMIAAFDAAQSARRLAEESYFKTSEIVRHTTVSLRSFEELFAKIHSDNGLSIDLRTFRTLSREDLELEEDV